MAGRSELLVTFEVEISVDLSVLGVGAEGELCVDLKIPVLAEESDVRRIQLALRVHTS